jgi:hypothetical protein
MGKELDLELFLNRGVCTPSLSALESSSSTASTETSACSASSASILSTNRVSTTHGDCSLLACALNSLILDSPFFIANVEGNSLSYSGSPIKSTVAITYLS